MTQAWGRIQDVSGRFALWETPWSERLTACAGLSRVLVEHSSTAMGYPDPVFLPLSSALQQLGNRPCYSISLRCAPRSSAPARCYFRLPETCLGYRRGTLTVGTARRESLEQAAGNRQH